MLKNGEFLSIVVVVRKAILYKESDAFRYAFYSVTFGIAIIPPHQLQQC